MHDRLENYPSHFVGEYSERYDYDESGNVIYLGKALSGSDESENCWRLCKFIYSDGKLISKLYAKGKPGFLFSWADRTSYEYL